MTYLKISSLLCLVSVLLLFTTAAFASPVDIAQSNRRHELGLTENPLINRGSSPEHPYGFLPLLKNLPLCVPPEVVGAAKIYPKSAVTTKQTGKDCTKYGDPPAKIVGPIISPSGLEEAVQICHGKIIHFTDVEGTRRTACFYANPASTRAKPLPLLVWLHPSVFSATLTFPITGIDFVRETQALNNEDASRLGFSYILPFGRNTVHQYPIPDNVGLGWDNWYRNTNRNDPKRNADVDFVDQAIAYAKANVNVDERRVFMSGWSNGASFALFYALNTDKIAAASVYSAPDPWRDSQDPCTQTPNPKFATAIRDIHNKCDIIGTCTTGKYFYKDLQNRYGNKLRNSLVILDVLTGNVDSKDSQAECDPSCQGVCAVTSGSAAHARYPILRNNDTVFQFMHDNPLPLSGTWGRL